MLTRASGLNFLRRLVSNPPVTFLVIALVFGLVLVFIQPPMAVNDEISHFSRAYEIAHGTLLTKKLGGSYRGNLGGAVPQAFVDLDGINTYQGYKKPNPVRLHHGIKAESSVGINEQKKDTITYANTALYSPVAYIPQAVVIKIGSLLNLSVLQTFYSARIVVLLCFSLVVALAIRIAPVKKWFFVVIGLLPMTLQEAASVSIDSLIIAFSLLFLACFLYIYKTKDVHIKLRNLRINVLPIIFMSVTYVSLSKPVYFPLFLILLCLPGRVFKSNLSRAKRLCLLLVIPLILLIGWNVLVSHQGDAQGQRLSVNSVGIYPPDAKQGIKLLANPKYTTKLLVHTYIDEQSRGQVIPNYITQGFFGGFTSYFVTPPLWYMFTVGLTLLLSFFMREKDFPIFSTRLKLMALATLVMAWAGTTFSMFFYATTAGVDFINGIQGRYFIPLIGFAVLLLGTRPLVHVMNIVKTRLALMALVVFNLLFMQIILYQWFWHA